MRDKETRDVLFAYGFVAFILIGVFIMLDFAVKYHEVDMSIYQDKIIFENDNGTFYFPKTMNRTEVHNVTYVTIPNVTGVPAGVFL